MTIWQPDISQHRGPRYLAIVDALAEDIRAGRVQAGDKLPTHRDLAYHLGITVGTVTRAYAAAAQRGLTSGEVGRGTFVAGNGARSNEATTYFRREEGDTGAIDFGLNMPAPGNRAERLAETLSEISRSPNLDDLLAYETHGGMDSHRAAAASWIAKTGLDVQPEQIVICNGAQHALTTTLMSVTRPGDTIAAEALTYPAAVGLAVHLGIRIEAVDIDKGGMIPDSLEKLCRTKAPSALYVIPTLHNPTTANLDEGRRMAIADICRRYNVSIIDDDVYGYLADDVPAPLASFAPEISYHLAGVSKSMAPGLRVGYVVAPPGRADEVKSALNLTTWMAPPLTAEVARRWIEDGVADEFVVWHSQEARARQQILAQVLGNADIETKPYSYHAWLRLPIAWTADGFAEEAQRKGVVVLPSSRFAATRRPVEEAVRICLGSPERRDQVETGLIRLAEVLKQTPQINRPVF